MPDFASLSLPLLILVFCAGAAVVWYAGSNLARYADEIAERTGMGQATAGVVVLGMVTSLPEISSSSAAAISGNSNMAVNNLLGSASFQLVVLAICDLFMGREGLTTSVAGPRTLLNAAVSVVLLSLVAIGVMVGDWEVPLLRVGFFTLLVAGTYVLCLWQLSGAVAVSGWKPVDFEEHEKVQRDRPEMSNRRLALLTVFAAALILVAGTVITYAAEALADKTGVSTGIMGLTLLSVATSLPEFSTAITAARMRRAELAIGDILGGNMFNMTLLLLVDALETGGPVLRQVDRSAMTASLLAILLTMFYLIGLVERRDRSVLRMGYDSIAVVVVYIAGMGAILFGVIGA